MNKLCDLDFSVISKRRGVVMGIAALFIMLFHSFFNDDSNIVFRTIGQGDIGVDIFLVLSAVGLYCSFSKDADLYSYFVRRFYRIVPLYVFCAIPVFAYQAIECHSIVDFILNISLITVLKHVTYFWYIAEILICYAIFPLYYELVRKERVPIWITVVFFGWMWLIAKCVPDAEFIFQRIPIFLLGVHIGKFVCEHKKIKCSYFVSSAILSVAAVFIIGFFEVSLGVKWFVYFFSAVPQVLLLSIINYPKWLEKFFAFFGSISLELYLIHCNYFLHLVQNFIINSVFVCLVSIVAAVGACYFVHILYGKFSKKMIDYLLNK